MTSTLITRSFSFVIAAVMSLAMLGGIDHLAQPQVASGSAVQMSQAVPASQG